MKKSKKYISIILPLIIFLFVGLVSIPDLALSDTKTVSDSITVLVEDPDDGDEKPVCSQKTYQCEKGTVINEKTTEGSNQFVYIWDCELDDEIESCEDPMPTCGDFSYNDGSNWTGGCDGGDTAEKKYDKESNTYKWQCRGTEGDPIQECSYKPKDGQCGDDKGDCIKGQASEVTEAEDGSSSWQCLGSGGGETDYCFLEGPDKPIEPPIIPPVKDPINGICGSSNGLFFTQEPASDLCEQGELSGKVLKQENNSWAWTCAGLYGGENAKCNTMSVSLINGICGSSNGLFFTQEPASDLCEQGELSGKVLKQENNSWAWTCAGLYGGENAKCNTMSVSLTPKLSGCYIGQDQSSCQIEEPFNWLVSGIYNLLSLVTNKSEIALEGGSGQKNLEIGYPFSDIELKVNEGEVASSRAWAVCAPGLYWDSVSSTCLKPKACPGEPDYQEPETPYWTYEQTSPCEILQGEEVGQLTITGTCQNYNQEEGMFCHEADGADYPIRTKDIKYDCFLNPSQQPSTIDVSLDAKRLDGVDIDEENPSTERSFMVSWKAVVNPLHKFKGCEEIEVREPGSSEVKYTIDIDNEESSGVKEQSHPGTPGSLELSLTCHDKNGKKAIAKKTVYFDRITGSQIEY